VTQATTEAQVPTREAPVLAHHSNAYNIFILVLTLLSLAVMVAMILPLDSATHQILQVYDNLICVVFLIDFSVNITKAQPKRAYWIGQRGWLDLLGSIPSFGGTFQLAALFRLARLSRLGRVGRLLSGKNKKELIKDVVENRGQYAIFITLLLMLIVLTTSSVLILQFEQRSPDANIKTGGDALWWAIVTITTVGYGDFFPVTALGRSVGVVVMFSGVGIIGALASILASILVPSPKEPEVPEVDPMAAMESELAGVRAELTSLRELLTADRTAVTDPSTAPG
jgi:voltage-gated potassium channel